MAARDKIHSAVKEALIKDGWTITHDPYQIKYGERKVEIDLAAEHILAAERDTSKIVVEIKSFLRLSLLQDLKDMLGSYQLYFPLVAKTAPEYTLFVAIPHRVYDDNFDEPMIALAIEANQIPLVVVDIVREEIVQWIK